MEEFSSISRLKINFQKSKLFVSPNIDRRKTRELSSLCNIPITSDLGRYLGVPILHQRANQNQFNFILEKMQNKLVGWKMKVVPMAGRTTLIQSVTPAIPTYSMQTMVIPKQVCNDIDRINRNFLWGDEKNSSS